MDFSKMSAHEVSESVPLSTGGSKARYPWYEYNVGESFFVPMSQEDLKKGKCRPGPPKGVKDSGRIWETKSIYNSVRKQYGYKVTRIA